MVRRLRSLLMSAALEAGRGVAHGGRAAIGAGHARRVHALVAGVLAAGAIGGCAAPVPRTLGDLEVRVLDDPRDVRARLALARIADEAHRPTQALEQLEAVQRLGGPLGARWADADRARFARLLAARGRARLARGAATALADLVRAREAGAPITAEELAQARAYVAIDQLRHVDTPTREAGRRTLAELAGQPFADASWLGAKADPVPRDRALFGVWLWEHGARRAAFETLAAWRAASAERDAATSPFHAAYLRALAWWLPIDAAVPAGVELVGPERCRFAAAACQPAELLAELAREQAAVRALLVSPVAPTAVGRDAGAWATLALVQLLDGAPGGWGARIAQRVALDRLALATVPAYARPIFARLAVAPIAGVPDAQLGSLSRLERLVVAAERVLAGASRAEVLAALGPDAGEGSGPQLLAMFAPSPPAFAGPARDAAIARFVVAHAPGEPAVAAILAAYRRDPAIADRLARDVVAEATDAAHAHATLGTLWSALGDPARARAAWQAAVDSSAEPLLVRGLAEATARAGDPDAALVWGMTAAAGSGDPAPVWTQLARALEDVGAHPHALEAARYAIDLASAEALPAALDIAIAASRALARDEQATTLGALRATLAPPLPAQARDDDPTDATAAVAAHAHAPTAATIARLWIAARWNVRDVPVRAALLAAIAADDPRRDVIVRELVALAGDRDPDVGRAAIAALAGT